MRSGIGVGIAAIIAGVLILVWPAILNWVVGIFLIIWGILAIFRQT